MKRRVITGSGKNVREYVKQNGNDVIAFPETLLDVNEQAEYTLGLSDEGLDIVTFSPWIISDFPEDNVFTVEDDLSLRWVSFNTYGASVNKINIKILGRASTIGEKSRRELRTYADDEKSTVKDIDYKFGESVEKMLVLKSLFDKEEERANVI